MQSVEIIGGEPKVVSIDAPTGQGQRVHVRSVGICGSDIALMRAAAPKFRLGHEFAGVLDDGTPVAVKPTLSCGVCARCHEDNEQQCASAFEHMYGWTADGGLAEEILVNPRCVVSLPPHLDANAAALVEPVAVALHGVNRLSARSGERVLVVGAGTIGLSAVAVLQTRGVEVDVAAKYETQRGVAAQLGAHVAVHDHYDAVLHCAGPQETLDVALARCRRGGRVVEFGTWWKPVQLSQELVTNEISLITSATYTTTEFVRAAELIVEMSLSELLVTHHFTFAEAADAFRAAGDREGGTIKVHLHPTAC